MYVKLVLFLQIVPYSSCLPSTWEGSFSGITELNLTVALNYKSQLIHLLGNSDSAYVGSLLLGSSLFDYKCQQNFTPTYLQATLTTAIGIYFIVSAL